MTDRRRIAAVLLMLGLVAASCGSGDATTTPLTLGTTAPAAEAAPDSTFAAGDAMADDATDDQGTDEATDNGTEDAMVEGAAPAAEEAPEPEEPAEPVANLFPDLDVQNISDGSTVNLASALGGGTTATLLWFFAPH